MSTTKLQNETKWVRTARVTKTQVTPQIALQSTLNLEIGEFRLRFFCELNQQCIWLEDYSSDAYLSNSDVLENLRLLVFDHPVLTVTAWKSVNVLINSDTFTLIPEALFRKEYSSRYLQLTQGHPVLAENKALFRLFSALGCYNVFQVPQAWWDFFQDHFALQQLTFSHISHALINGFNRNTETRQPQVNVYVQEGHLLVIVFEKGRLMFCNRFRFQNAEEATFFVLSCLNELNYLPEGVQLTLAGETTPFSGLYAELSKFLPHINFAKKPDHLTYPPAFDELADHRYFALLSVGNLW